MINKKGFVLIETIIVMSVLLIGMIVLYSNYNKMIINSSKVNYYDNVEDMYIAYYAYKYVNDLTTWDSDKNNLVINNINDDNFKKIFGNLKIEKIYYFSKNGFNNIFEVNEENKGDCTDNENQLLCYDGTTINYLRSIENKNEISKCDDSNKVPCITIVKINRDDHYYFAKYEAYDNNEIKIEDDIPSEIKPYIFEYTGKTQIFNVPYSGEYKLEVWGAQGGYGNNELDYPGGYGGYSVGTISLHKGDNLFVVVGGKGESATSKKAVAVAGGYNGGGTGYGSTSYYVSGGGGATHIALESGLLNSFEGKKESVLIVAGGGGGSAYQNNSNYGLGGSSGGKEGLNAISTVKGENVISNSSGGTQISGGMGTYLGTFGKGASCDVDKKPCSGGGGGLYGGGSGATVTGGSGGSSYINSIIANGIMYCYNCNDELGIVKTNGTNETLDKTNCQNGYSADSISNCAKAGDGYAKITYINSKR